MSHTPTLPRDGTGDGPLSHPSWTYDGDKNITSVTTRINENGTLRTETRSYTYDNDHRPVSVSYGNISESISYDSYSRMSGKTVQLSSATVLSTAYSYRDIGTEYTTTQISGQSSSYGNTTLSHSYTYDANGNLLTDSDGTHTTEYEYDSLNQLVWEKNAAAGKAWQYTYDLGGNILTKTEYDYVNGATSNPQTVSYTYGDSAWHDLLTAWNGQTITYDGIGNPTSYRGWTMSWQGGRQLAGMTDGAQTLSFAYNEAGLRTEKTVGNVSRKYIWNDTQLLADVGPNDAFYFHYNASGEMVGYSYRTSGGNAECLLVKNQQGDVEKVISVTGAVLASYSYDVWGRVLTATGTMANANPIRYRGYYYDTETDLYYLQSRYYDPAVGRFVNVDSLASSGKDILGCNMFVYCGNNPVNSIDPFGMWTIGISLGANLNLFLGVSVSIGVFLDDNRNVEWQWSYAIPGVNETTSFGLLDAGVGLAVQSTNRDTIYDLYGSTTYLGVSAGPGWYVGADLISFSKPNEIDADVDGFQFVAGGGIGLDAHISVTDTKPIRSETKSIYRGFGSSRRHQRRQEYHKGRFKRR